MTIESTREIRLHRESNEIVASLLKVVGSGFIVLALTYNEFLLGIFIHDLHIIPRAIVRVKEVQTYFLFWGIALFALSWCVRRIRWFAGLFNRRMVMNLFLSAFSLIVMTTVLEFALRPFAYLPGKGTRIFIRDDDLGWKLKPGLNDRWANVQVSINNKGMRGREVPYARKPHAKRILYLGDSVTFGFGLESDQAFPFRTEALLNSMMDDSVETINAGVDGYSPWQEFILLTKEGLKYTPDIIVVSFVLNDVTEKSSLIRFGGWHEGWQLENARDRGNEIFNELVSRSNILYFVRMIGTRLRFGSDVQAGARHAETLQVGHLVYYPERPEVRDAWKSTLDDLGKIFDVCRRQGIPVILVVFPFAFQFENVAGLSTPQRVVCTFAQKQNIPVVDLLPVFDAHRESEGVDIQKYFLDDLHPSALGSSIVADTLSRLILKTNLLSSNRDE